MTLIRTPEVYGNFAASDKNGLSLAARVLAQRVAGVIINPNPPALDSLGLPRKILAGSFDLLVNPEARTLVDRVMGAPEVKLLYDVGAYPYPGPHNINSFCESKKEPNLYLIPDATRRIEIARLNRRAIVEQLEADLSFKHSPIEAVKHDVSAIFAKRTAEWLSEGLLPTEHIVNQVIDREKAFLSSLNKVMPILSTK